MPVDLEMLAQLEAEIAATETVGTQHLVAAALGHEGTDLLGVVLHVIGRSDHRPGGAAELLGNE